MSGLSILDMRSQVNSIVRAVPEEFYPARLINPSRIIREKGPKAIEASEYRDLYGLVKIAQRNQRQGVRPAEVVMNVITNIPEEYYPPEMVEPASKWLAGAPDAPEHLATLFSFAIQARENYRDGTKPSAVKKEAATA